MNNHIIIKGTHPYNTNNTYGPPTQTHIDTQKKKKTSVITCVRAFVDKITLDRKYVGVELVVLLRFNVT